MHVPYIGITGFTSRKQIEAVLNDFSDGTDRKLMAGVLASSKTICGEQNKWPKRYPMPHELSDIFVPSLNTLNLVHFNTKEPKTLQRQLIMTRHLAGPWCDGFQLNIAWPEPEVLQWFKQNPVRKTVIVLQVGARAFEAAGSEKQLATLAVEQYGGIIDYLLLDSSGGLGRGLDTEKLLGYLHSLRMRGAEQYFGLGVAGGLSAETLHLIEPLLREFPHLSIDAEGLLRDNEDSLDIDHAKRYIKNAHTLFSAA